MASAAADVSTIVDAPFEAISPNNCPTELPSIPPTRAPTNVPTIGIGIAAVPISAPDNTPTRVPAVLPASSTLPAMAFSFHQSFPGVRPNASSSLRRRRTARSRELTLLAGSLAEHVSKVVLTSFYHHI